MEQGRVERLDHCGVMASVSKDLGLIAMLDTRLVPDDQEVITPGEAVAAMRLNGLGCAQRPLALTPQCFANNPRDLWLREGIAATMVNRFKLGRTLAAASAYGCDLLLEELARAIGAPEGMARGFHPLDTPSVARTGADGPDSDEHAMPIPHGDAKAHRPALQQAGWALLVSHDGASPG